MEVVLGRRTGADRREFAIYYRYGCERRNNTGNRRLDTVKNLQPYFSGNASHAYGLESETTIEIVNKIAEAFGIHPDTLEMLGRDDLTVSSEICGSCEDQMRLNADLKTELAKSRRDFELYRKHIGNLLLSFSTAKVNKLP